MHRSSSLNARHALRAHTKTVREPPLASTVRQARIAPSDRVPLYRVMQALSVPRLERQGRAIARHVHRARRARLVRPRTLRASRGPSPAPARQACVWRVSLGNTSRRVARRRAPSVQQAACAWRVRQRIPRAARAASRRQRARVGVTIASPARIRTHLVRRRAPHVLQARSVPLVRARSGRVLRGRSEARLVARPRVTAQTALPDPRALQARRRLPSALLAPSRRATV